MISNPDPILAGLAARIIEAINTCLQRGMTLPFIVAMVSPNSSLMCVRYDRNEVGNGLVATPLAECGAGFALPINIMITDQRAEVVCLTVAGDGRTTYH